MHIRTIEGAAGLSALLCAIMGGTAQAGGIMTYEVGQEGAGLANAGAAVLTDDPSVMMNNPAGISQLQGTQFAANGQLILGDINFSRDSGNDFSGNEGGNVLRYMPGSSLFVSHRLDERSSIGFGMYGNFGLAVDYDDDWAGRYFTREASVLGLSLQPTYAYQLTDDLSVGIGPRLMYALYRTEAAINNNVLGSSGLDDGKLEFKDSTVGYGVNLGLLYQLNPRTRLGLAYTSRIRLNFDDRVKLEDVSNPVLGGLLNRLDVRNLDMDMEVPQTVLASLSYQLDEQWKLLGSLGWQDWSSFGDIGAEVEAAPGTARVSVDRKYKDTWHLSVGAQYQYTPQWRWSFGLGYDSSMVDDHDRTADNPAGAAWRLGTGVNYRMRSDLELHLTYTLVWLGDMSLEQTKSTSGNTLSGSYDRSALHILGGGAVWRF